MLTRDQAKAITDRVLSLSQADETFVEVRETTNTHLRFARNMATTSGSYVQPALTISSTLGTRTGTVEVNQFDDDALAAAVRRAEDMARHAPEDPEHMPVLGPQTYPRVEAFSEKTASGGAGTMAEAVSACLAEASAAELVAAGFAQTRTEAVAIASSRGLFGYHRETGAYLAETLRTSDGTGDGDGTGSGWASASSHRAADIDYRALSRTAIAKARKSADPKPIEPGSYVTILEPACMANLMGLFLWNMDARSADEGRSYFAAAGGGSRRGEALFPEQVNLYSDPRDTRAPSRPWGDDGVPQARRDWIRDGVLANLVTDRFWAQKTGVEPIPRPSNLIMTGGQGTVEDLIASTERGLLVTSLWYIRAVDPRTLLYTGITRDGVFWIEDGKIAHPVRNLRWNDSPIKVLENIDAMTAPVRVPPRPSKLSSFVVPAVRVKEFAFSSVSDAV